MQAASMAALRQLAMTQQRATAASTQSAALAALGLAFGQKLADARRTYQGAALHSALAALMQERQAAAGALMARLAGAGNAERRAIARQFRAQKRPPDLSGAAQETTRRQSRPPHCPCERRRAVTSGLRQ